jgi:hypothetical protein
MEQRAALEGLTARIEELITVLNYIVRDLSEVSKTLKATLQTPQSAPAAQPLEHMPEPDDIASAFPEDLQRLLKFEDKGDYIVIRPSGFLGADNFGRIANIVRTKLGGDYVSAGKESHFRVPKKQETVET